MASIILLMPVAHATGDPMYEAICYHYAEIGLPEDNIAGSASEFVRLLNNRANDFQGLEPYQVRHLASPRINNLDPLRSDQLVDLAVTAIHNYGLILAGLQPSD